MATDNGKISNSTEFTFKQTIEVEWKQTVYLWTWDSRETDLSWVYFWLSSALKESAISSLYLISIHFIFVLLQSEFCQRRDSRILQEFQLEFRSQKQLASPLVFKGQVHTTRSISANYMELFVWLMIKKLPDKAHSLQSKYYLHTYFCCNHT